MTDEVEEEDEENYEDEEELDEEVPDAEINGDSLRKEPKYLVSKFFVTIVLIYQSLFMSFIANQILFLGFSYSIEEATDHDPLHIMWFAGACLVIQD